MALVKGKPDSLGEWYDTNNMFRQPVPVEKTRYTDPTPLFYSVGVDLGSVNDSTAITVLEIGHGWEVVEGHTWRGGVHEIKRQPDLHFLLRLLHRPRLGTPYPKIVEQVAAIMDDLPPLPKPPTLVFDGTGLGMPVVQMARKAGLRVTSIAITAGQTAILTGRDWSVPKALLVGELRLAMHQKRLKVAQGFAARETLETELSAFTAKLSASGRATFEAAGAEHDDTVLSLSMAVLAAKTRFQNTARLVPVLGF
jgi:hypothetical protein